MISRLIASNGHAQEKKTRSLKVVNERVEYLHLYPGRDSNPHYMDFESIACCQLGYRGIMCALRGLSLCAPKHTEPRTRHRNHLPRR